MTDDRGQDGHARVDLSPLDQLGDAARFEGLVRGVLRAAAPELARRQAPPPVYALIARWRRPVLAASGLLAAASLAVLLLTHPVSDRRETLAEAGGVPREWATWAQADRNPTPGELLLLDQESR